MPRHLLSAASVALAIATAATASPQTACASLSFQPEIGLPAANVAVIGASPGEAPGETWAQGQLGGVPAVAGGAPLANSEVLLRYTTQSGSWQIVPVENSQGEALPISWWGSEVTPDGGVVLVGSEAPEFKGAPSILTRNPGGAFAKTPTPSTTPTATEPTPALGNDEQLLATTSSSQSTEPVMAALDETDRLTGLLLVPAHTDPSSESSGSTGSSDSSGSVSSESSGEPSSGSSGSGSEAQTPGVLHYDGNVWTREPICEQYAAEECTAPSGAITALALSASSPGNAWLLAETSSEPLMLFQRVREPEGKQVWLRRKPASWLLGSGTAPLSGESVSALKQGPMLTAAGQGVWVDVALTDGANSGNATVLVSPGTNGEVAGIWCYAASPTPLCPGDGSLGAPLSSDYGSFAWPGAGAGTRVITGLPEGALLVLREGQSEFAYTVGGGAGGADGAIGPGDVTLGTVPGSGSRPIGGAAFSSPEEGWLGAGTTPAAIHVTANPAADSLVSWPTPFREPLLAIAGQPGATPGEGSAQALAVGVDGEVARYLPGEGWTPEYLYNSSGERQTPNLRGVAWPESERAYAVGDEGAMWLWQSSTGQWEPDPAAPIGFRGQLTGIAFSPIEPGTGYAVGKQGVLLSYGKTWTQETPPPGLSQANFTSVAFAAGEAIASYRMLDPTDTSLEIGGLIINQGHGWQVEPEAESLLAGLPSKSTVLSKVAGVPDGGAVAAGPGVVIERDSASGHWHLSSQPLPEAENVAALAAVEEGSSVQALVSLDTNDNPNVDPEYEEIDNPPGPALGQYEVLLGPDPLPWDGYLVRQTPGGWQDQEHQDYPYPENGITDLPGWPDPVFALLISPDGTGGWAVGGKTGAEIALGGPAGVREAAQTAGIMRYGAGPSPAQNTSVPISIPAGEATFAVGGEGQCRTACGDLANENLGPDAWLSGAVSRASQIAGLRAFLYTGASSEDATPLRSLGADAFSRELEDHASLLGAGGSLPAYAAISPPDVADGGTIAPFTAVMGSHAPARSVPAGTPAPPEGTAAYAFNSPGATGTVRVIVLDYSQSELSANDTVAAPCPGNWEAPVNQLQWLCAQLHDAKVGVNGEAPVPAIVLGNANVSEPDASNYATDAQAVDQVLLSQGASAYLFDSPEQNVSETIGSGCDTIPAYGSGTLGYVGPPLNDPDDFLGASGFLTVSVNTAERDACTGAAPVTATLIPSIGQLGLNATDGTLLRRSHVALFEGLARRPLGGSERQVSGSGDISAEPPNPYTAIPEVCEGSNCEKFIAPAYSFTSSKPDVGNFVEQDPNSINPLAVLQVNGKPVADSTSGLFCAYNAGTTTVTLTTGGLSYSEQVTVQGGSVEQPCGTVLLRNQPAAEESQSPPTVASPPPTESPPTTEPFLALAPPPLPVTPAKPATHHHVSPAPFPAALLAPVALLAPLRAALPPPPPQAARPTPPSGTSAVEALEREREEQGAVDLVHNVAVYEPTGNSLPPWSPLVLMLIAAAVGSSIRRRRLGRSPATARASLDPPPQRSRR
ncbi:MAG TPA: hypothetical protein VGP18_10115 [Solirubrobacteraceae bacterium]|jgi:hypothetical protein|nr:hypothetical protein [Solirubrobacteraceae bacterium]